MRMVITLTIILAIIIGGALATNHTLQTSADELAKHINTINASINDEHWQQASEHMNTMEKIWEDKSKWWGVFLDHQEMDNIEFSLAKAKTFVTSEESALALAQLAELKLMIEHIPLSEKPVLQNIL